MKIHAFRRVFVLLERLDKKIKINLQSMILIIKGKDMVLIGKQNPNGGPVLKSFPVKEDPVTGQLGYQVGFCGCGCGEPILMRTVDVRLIVNKFGYSLEEYEKWYASLRPRISFRHKLIHLLGGKVGD